jgi:hypothetical protein
MWQFLFRVGDGQNSGRPVRLARPASPQIVQAFPGDGDETAKYKAIAALFDRMTPPCQKAMANRAERAHGLSMSHHARFQLLQIDAGRRS